MNIEQYRDYCIRKKGVTEHFPFDEDTLVFKVMGKMFALTSLKKWEEGDHSINLKCDPDWGEELRAKYEAIVPGYHMSKIHWNTVAVNSDVPLEMVLKLIDHSYDLVVAGLTKKLQAELENLPE
jgi:predicted DNA-binding protein (MmcQ/YjbR family)